MLDITTTTRAPRSERHTRHRTPPDTGHQTQDTPRHRKPDTGMAHPASGAEEVLGQRSLQGDLIRAPPCVRHLMQFDTQAHKHKRLCSTSFSFLHRADAASLDVQIDAWRHSTSGSGSSLQQGQHTGYRRWSWECGRCCTAAHEVFAMRRSDLESMVWAEGSGGNTAHHCEGW